MDAKIKEIIESLVFISQEPLSLERMKEVLQEFPVEEVEQAFKELQESYASKDHGIKIIQRAEGYLLSTKPEYDLWVRRLLKMERKNRLSSASLETLSAIAYQQPTTLSEISALRGVDSTHTLKTLLQKKLIRIVGRKKSPGSPLLYRTTDKFLIDFGLNRLDDLPSPEEIKKILEEQSDLEE
jgi:segregation and condensation protein B